MVMPHDVLETRNGKELTIEFFGHGSVGFEYDGRHVYVDPVSYVFDYSAALKADMILVTHEHGDHLDSKAIDALSGARTEILSNPTAHEALDRGDVLKHGEVRDLGFVRVEAVAAYNTSPAQLNFHPRERRHNGYVLTFGDTRVYVAGDSEPTPEMLALKDIDIAFLPVNQPYTMTEEQATEAVKTLKPRIFYPYHFGGTDHKTDLEKLHKLLEGSGVEVRIRPLE